MAKEIILVNNTRVGKEERENFIGEFTKINLKTQGAN